MSIAMTGRCVVGGRHYARRELAGMAAWLTEESMFVGENSSMAGVIMLLYSRTDTAKYQKARERGILCLPYETFVEAVSQRWRPIESEARREEVGAEKREAWMRLIAAAYEQCVSEGSLGAEGARTCEALASDIPDDLYRGSLSHYLDAVVARLLRGWTPIMEVPEEEVVTEDTGVSAVRIHRRAFDFS